MPCQYSGVRQARHVCSAVFISLALLGASAEARVVYVDGGLSSSCSSNNYSVAARACNGSDGPAYTTFASAMGVLQAGDTLAIRGGTYRTPLLVTKSGTASAHILIAAHHNESVVLDLRGTSGSGIDVSSRQYVDVSGLIVQNAAVYGFKGADSSNITLSNCEMAYSAHGGVVIETGSNISVRSCKVHHSNNSGNWHEGVSFENVTGFEIVDSEVYENNKEGIDAKYNSTGGTIAYNRSYRNNGPNIYIDAASSISVYGNVCYDARSNQKPCIALAIESTYNPNRYVTRDIRLYNNVMWGSAAGLIFWIETVASWARFDNIRIEYNTIVDNSTNNWGGIVVLNGGAQNFGTGNTIRNNIIMGNGGNSGRGIRDDFGVLQSFTIANNLFQSGESSAVQGSGAISTSSNPFVNRSSKDYHLVSGSPARGIGLAIPDIRIDLDKKPRPASSTDVGAYQYGSAAPAPSPPTNLRINPS
jgi:hypothetical protein